MFASVRMISSSPNALRTARSLSMSFLTVSPTRSLIALPMPSATRFASGIGNEVGNAWTSVMRSSGGIEDFRVDQVEGALAAQHAQHLAGGGDSGALARRGGDAGEVRRQDDVVELE